VSDVVLFLKGVSGFEQVDSADIEAISDQVEEVSFAAGEKLMARGDPGDTMYVIVEGRVRIPLRDKDSGEILNQAYLGPSDMVGEMALLTGEPRSADVIAETPVSAIAIRRETLLPLLEAHPKLARFLTEILGTRLEAGGGIEKVGKYRLLGKLGQGATSKVYQALHPDLNRIVAIKMLSHALVYDARFKERFLEEARTIAGLSHPNLVQIYDTEAAYMTYFIVMEKVSGTDLARILRRRKKLSPDHALRILSQVAEVLEYAHSQGIVHRDVKPANCMLDESGLVKLMDFGIARRIDENPSQDRAKVVEGTPRYLAPEAAVGRPVDGRADIYALGILAFEMVTGEVPFSSDNIRDLLKMHARQEPPDIEELEPGLPSGLVEFVRGALIKRPDERLTDWPTIHRLLAPEGVPPRAGQGGRKSETEMVSISFPSERRDEVDAAVETLVSQLAVFDDVQVATARMTALGSASGDQHITAAAADSTQASSTLRDPIE
jgi:serine/threonine protein kinase